MHNQTNVSPAPRRAHDAPTKLRYRLARAPIVIVYATSDAPYFQVRVRMNRPLPVDNQGVRANFLVGRSSSDDVPVRFGRRSSNCYASVVGNDVSPDPQLADARPGSKARLTIRVAGQRPIVRTVALHASRHANVAALGCGRSGR